MKQFIFEFFSIFHLKGISRLWKQADDDENRILTLPEFQKMVLDHNIRITKDESSQLFREFDFNGSGTLDYDEFLAKLTVII